MISERAERNEDEIESSTQITRAPAGFWTLSQIVDWIAFGESLTFATDDREALIDQAAELLLLACRNRIFILIGIQAEHETGREIPQMVFADPVWFFLPGNSIEPDDAAASPEFVVSFVPWQHVRGLERDVRALWPTSLTEQSAMPSGLAEVARTGAPGRPSSMHWVLEELERRITAGSLEHGVRAEATSLLSWFVSLHSALPTPTVRTIENRIRQRFNQARLGAMGN